MNIQVVGFDFEVKYKPDFENGAADALPRKMTNAGISTVQFHDFINTV